MGQHVTMQRTVVAVTSGNGRFQALSEKETLAPASQEMSAMDPKVTSGSQNNVVVNAPMNVGTERTVTVHDTIKRKEGLMDVTIAQMEEAVVFTTQKPLEEKRPAQMKAMNAQKVTMGQQVSGQKKGATLPKSKQVVDLGAKTNKKPPPYSDWGWESWHAWRGLAVCGN
ncbi:unnamed protein product [Linum trigynum]|uniref:Uncharacterized protein n=1 Tax=Linum trigynum TaxID=586398 RepID=A0AAV2D8W1_9ROSI